MIIEECRILAVAAGGGDCSITQEQVFNAKTGRGGLHGLRACDFGNYQNFRVAKQITEWGQFFTPDSLTETIYEFNQVDEHDHIADLTCGMVPLQITLPFNLTFSGLILTKTRFRRHGFFIQKQPSKNEIYFVFRSLVETFRWS